MKEYVFFKRNGKVYKFKNKYKELNNKDLMKYDKKTKRLKKHLNKEQIEALTSYTGGGFEEINSRMRGIKPRNTYIYNGDIEEIDKDTTIIKKLLEKGKIKENTLLFRGGYQKFNNKSGDIIENKGFISASTNKNIALDKANKRGYKGTLSIIQTPKNIKGLYMGDNFNDLNEKEMLISDKYNFKYIHKTKISNGRYENVPAAILKLIDKNKKK